MDLEQVVLDLAPQAEERVGQRRAKVCRVGAGGEMEHTPELVRSPLVDEIVPVDVSQVMTPDPITVGPRWH
jgi:hypothetical protein